jgi:hypothetical protein
MPCFLPWFMFQIHLQRATLRKRAGCTTPAGVCVKLAGAMQPILGAGTPRRARSDVACAALWRVGCASRRRQSMPIASEEPWHPEVTSLCPATRSSGNVRARDQKQMRIRLLIIEANPVPPSPCGEKSPPTHPHMAASWQSGELLISFSLLVGAITSCHSLPTPFSGEFILFQSGSS